MTHLVPSHAYKNGRPAIPCTPEQNVCHPAPVHTIPIHTHPRTRPRRLVLPATPPPPPCLHPAAALPHGQDATAGPAVSASPRVFRLCAAFSQARARVPTTRTTTARRVLVAGVAARSPSLHRLVCLLPSAPHHTTASAHLDRTHAAHTPAVCAVPCVARSGGRAFTSRARAAGQVAC